MNLIERYNPTIDAKKINVGDMLILIDYNIPENDCLEDYNSIKPGDIVRVEEIEDECIDKCLPESCKNCPSGHIPLHVSKPDDEHPYASCWYKFKTLNGRTIV